MELIVVIVVVGILSATILPHFAGTFHGTLLSSTARELAASVKLAASQAITVGRPHRLIFDADDGRYWLEVLTDSEDGPRGYKKVSQGQSVSARAGTDTGIIDPRITLEVVPLERQDEDMAKERRKTSRRAPASGPPAIFFQPDGTADGCRMLLRDPDGFGVELRVHPGTSRVTAHDLRREARR